MCKVEFVEPIRDKKQIENMKTFLKGKSLRDYLLFVLGINSALRISDILNLKVSDMCEIVKGKYIVASRISLKEQKTNKSKDFPLSSNAVKALSEYLQNVKLDGNDFLFARKKGKDPITRQQAYRILNAAAKAVGVPGRIGTHTMRKTFGYWAYTSGVDVALIQKLLNHSAPSVTLRYIGITQDQMDDVYINLNL